MNKIAYITGITGQDGSYLSEYLLELGYTVYGMVRRMSLINTSRIDHILQHPRIELLYGDITDSQSISSALQVITQKHTGCDLEVYHLAAQSHVRISFDTPEYTTHADAIGTLKLLQQCHSVDKSGLMSSVKVYIAETSELYGKSVQIPQDENTPFNPCSPYAISKLYSYHIAKMYREGYGMFIAIGILFNHESPRRTVNFVTRKITTSIGKIMRGELEYVQIGNLDTSRDWGHARDYVKAMHMMLQHGIADDFVVATQQTRTVREFIEYAFSLRNICISWRGKKGSVEEEGIDQDGNVRIKVNPKYYRPIDVPCLLGDSSKANRELGWRAEITFEDLVREMVDFDAPV